MLGECEHLWFCADKNSMRGNLIIFLFILFFMGCAHHKHKVGRLPNSTVEAYGCADLVLPLVDEAVVLRTENWQVEELAQKNLIIYEEWDSIRRSESWQAFISREQQTDQEREMGHVILALLKKRFPKVSDDGLRDRYRVLLSWCGG